ncbi:hypothetical protein PMAA_083850 [Paecilomyces variotii No. 5]|uniref:Uncharacterized protein n=1 Tax=Byssochlamys spectabilis (strain No. 5 / NBRC 109023) TaxID=1356009 RepID=V5I327_BYSSN|nr:hypothetical protein PMAA_083850 [Paecilomyces variotii No. 5]
MSTISSTTNALLSTISQTTASLLPPPRRAAITRALTDFYLAHPFLTTLLAFQLVFCGVPILLFALFAAGVFLLSVVSALIVAALVTGLWAAVALLVLVPVVVGSVVFATGAWAWVWAGVLAWRFLVGRGYVRGWQAEKSEEQNEKKEKQGVRNGDGEAEKKSMTNGVVEEKEKEESVEKTEVEKKVKEEKKEKEKEAKECICEGDERMGGDQLEC